MTAACNKLQPKHVASLGTGVCAECLSMRQTSLSHGSDPRRQVVILLRTQTTPSVPGTVLAYGSSMSLRRHGASKGLFGHIQGTMGTSHSDELPGLHGRTREASVACFQQHSLH